MFKKNKNLHRAMIALLVLAFLVCMSFVLWAGAEEAPTQQVEAELLVSPVSTAAEGAQTNGEALENFINDTGIMRLIHNLDWQSLVMVVISFVLLYLAIGKGF